MNNRTNISQSLSLGALTGLTRAAALVALLLAACSSDPQPGSGSESGEGGSSKGGSSGSGKGGKSGGGSGGTSGGQGGSETPGSGGSVMGMGGAPEVDAAVEVDAAGDDAAVTADAQEVDAPVDTRPELPMTAVPAPWMGEDIGMVGMVGGSGRSGAKYLVKGAGGDIWSENDGFHFLHRPIRGDVEIVTRVTSIERRSPDGKAGIMLRESNAADARNLFMLTFPTNTTAEGVVMAGKGARLQVRDKKTDLITSFYDLATTTAPAIDGPPMWLKLVRKGPLFSGFFSVDGTTWVKDGEAMIPTMPMDLLAGLAVTSHKNDDGSMAAFEGLRLSALTDVRWSHAELGTLGGYVTGSPAKFDLASAGRGLANSNDGASFAYQAEQISADVEIVARVSALTYTTKAARVGFMIRGGLDRGERMLTFALELGPNGQRYVFVRRAQDNGNVTTSAGKTPGEADAGAVDMMAEPADPADAAADAPADPQDAGPPPPKELTPMWIKLVRVGNRFAGFIADRDRNNSWVQVLDLPSFVIARNGYVGVVLASGSEDGTATATVETVRIVSPPTTMLPPLPTLDGGADAEQP
jgi:hypothetical protein